MDICNEWAKQLYWSKIIDCVQLNHTQPLNVQYSIVLEIYNIIHRHTIITTHWGHVVANRNWIGQGGGPFWRGSAGTTGSWFSSWNKSQKCYLKWGSGPTGVFTCISLANDSALLLTSSATLSLLFGAPMGTGVDGPFGLVFFPPNADIVYEAAAKQTQHAVCV